MRTSKTVIAVSAMGMLSLLGTAPALGQSTPEKPVYTYVAEYKLKPAKAAEFWGYFEKTTQPILDGLVADGTVLEWARTSSLVHTEQGMSDSLWFCTRSAGTVTKVLEKIMAPRPANVLDAVEKHNDRLLQSLIFKQGKNGSTGYIETSSYVVKPGRGREWLDAFKRFQQPVYEQLLESGVILGYGIDRELVHTGPGGYRGIWVLLPDSDTIDKENDAFDKAFGDRSPEERRMMQMAMEEMTMAEHHRDGLERVLRYVRK